ncbi:DUF4328 domain-containing protein [Microbacterium sp. NPDC079995]|uniref:DUF4328 domain-containing protein n=1 Tax=unclassified Microbacterium TaxID=2609290 RepID=UPI00344FBE0C
MTDRTSAPAGWYPAPHAGNELRYWDGAEWAATPPAASAWPVPAGTTPGQHADNPVSAPPVIRPLRSIAGATRILLIVGAVVSFLTVLVEGWGLAAVDGFTRGTAPLSDLELYDTLSAPISLTSAGLMLATGICWVVWQYRAAVRVRAITSTATRRTPVWHVVSWFIPVVALWFPFQNVKDLVVASRANLTRGILGTWWGLWIASTAFVSISGRLSWNASTLADYPAVMSTSLLGELLSIAAASLAILILIRATDAMEPATR